MTASEVDTGETTVELRVNGRTHAVNVPPATPLLNVLRNDLGLLGAKRGCAQEQCYACSVLIDGRTQPSCCLPVERLTGTEITTVESEQLDELREFFAVEQVGQCAFCVSGMIVAAQGLLNRVRRPNDRQIKEALDTNLCRCGVYDRVRRAIRFRIGEPEESTWEIRRQAPLAHGKTETRGPSPSLRRQPDIDSWLAIDKEGTVTIFTGKAELGQGITTALAAIAAEELAVDFDRVRVVGPDTARSPDEGVTSGSLSVETSGAAIRAAAKSAKRRLLLAAATELGTAVERLVVRDGTIGAEGIDADTSYWALQGGRRFECEVDEQQPSGDDGSPGDDPGSPVAHPRIDLPSKYSGIPSFVHDLRLPGMLHGRVVRPPGLTARLTALDPTTAAAMAGVVAVVRDGSFLGVVAEREEQADAAAEALAASTSWTVTDPLPDPHDQLVNGTTHDYFVVDGKPVEGKAGSKAADQPPLADAPPESVVTATYTKPFTLHGSLGPSAATARLDGGELTVWSHTQGVFPLRGALAEVLDLAEDRIRVIHHEGAGCYGHNGADDVALDAALLAVAVPGRPVLVSWTRADEHRWEPWGPAMRVELGAVTDGGRIEAFDSRNWSYTHTTRPRPRGDGSTNLLAGWHRERPLTRPEPAPILIPHVGAHRNSDPLYRIGRKRIKTHLSAAMDYRTSALRALGGFANTFAVESFIDELAADAGIDPVEFRLANLDDERAIAVVTTAADAAGWADPTPDGHGRGIAFGRYKNSQTYLAVVVELAVDLATGSIDISKATIAADAGRIINPDGVSNQLEGGCVQAASWTLLEAVRLEAGSVVSDDWESYPVLRFSRSFPVSTVLLDRPDQPSLGCGEAAQGPTGAAIANAVLAASGLRLRDLPLTADKVIAAAADKKRSSATDPRP